MAIWVRYISVTISGDSRMKKVGGGHCGGREKVREATQMSILHGDFSLFSRLSCYD